MAQTSQTRTYHPEESAVFLKTRERFGGMSNMAGGFPLRVNGVSIRTSEALYQACRFPLAPDVQETIIAQKSPMTAKMRGKPHRHQTRPDWNTVRTDIMRWCLRVKLAQNRRAFGELLLATGDLPIVEMKKKRDDYWGAKIMDDGTLVGTNVLGRLLMELREQLKADAESLEVVAPLPIADFLLFGEPIRTTRAIEGGRTYRPANEPYGMPEPVAPIMAESAQSSVFERPGS